MEATIEAGRPSLLLQGLYICVGLSQCLRDSTMPIHASEPNNPAPERHFFGFFFGIFLFFWNFLWNFFVFFFLNFCGILLEIFFGIFWEFFLEFLEFFLVVCPPLLELQNSAVPVLAAREDEVFPVVWGRGDGVWGTLMTVLPLVATGLPMDRGHAGGGTAGVFSGGAIPQEALCPSLSVLFPSFPQCGGGGGQQPAQPPIRQLLGAADAQTAHPATSITAQAHQPLGSANAETTPARAPAAAADRKQRPDATCEGKNG